MSHHHVVKIVFACMFVALCIDDAAGRYMWGKTSLRTSGAVEVLIGCIFYSVMAFMLVKL